MTCAEASQHPLWGCDGSEPSKVDKIHDCCPSRCGVEEKICSVTAASQQFLQRETEYVAFCNVSDEDRNASVVRYLGEVSTATQGPPIIRVLAINATAGSLVITVSLDINGSVWCGAVHDEGEMTVYPSAEKLIQLGSPPADPQETDPGERSILLEGTVDWFDYFTRGRTYQVTCASEGMGPPTVETA